jgi:ribonucleoside-diphosphate reductase alpha chain
MENPNIGKLSSMYMYAWKAGIKTTYYLRSRPATKITKTTVTATVGSARSWPRRSSQAECGVFCSLENPEYCEACQ